MRLLAGAMHRLVHSLVKELKNVTASGRQLMQADPWCGTKRVLFAMPFYTLKIIVYLPKQARDKHRESSTQTRYVFSAGRTRGGSNSARTCRCQKTPSFFGAKIDALKRSFYHDRLGTNIGNVEKKGHGSLLAGPAGCGPDRQVWRSRGAFRR